MWLELDALVLQWIIGTVSDGHLPRLMGQVSNARAAWLKLEKMYLSNKKARAAALETQFCNLTLASCSSVDDYCERLNDLANQLEDVDQPVTESRLVLQLVRGLPQEYDTTASLIHQNNADWDTVRTMLQDEVIRMEARKSAASSVLLTQQQQQHPINASSATNHPSPNPNPNSYPTSYGTRGRGRGRGPRYRSNRGGCGRGTGRAQSGWVQQMQNYPNWAWWAPPPCPYPTQPAWQQSNFSPQQPMAQQPFGSAFSGPSQPNSSPQQTVQAQYSGFIPAQPSDPSGYRYNALSPSDLSAALSSL
ncbi:uncharacterized protein LOC110931891 [Helianthus annuus]|uniref:uncharacterized protein LOC110931891 n=1 Tax=Helianthus annuus TaxID=4232 RepID=UPI000B8F3DB1|nr:uncharacterized protein LOC110931891 [Helianthus annuus]